MLCPWWWFFWNVSAYGVMPRWAAPLTRTILVKRDESGNTDVWRFMHILLRVFGGVVGIAPEGGRTNTPHDPPVEAGERFWWSEDGTQKLRNLNVGKQTKVPTLAITTGSRILPVEVRVPFSDRADFISDTIQEWFRSGETITILVGEPYYPDPAQTLTEQNFELGLRMLAIPGRRSR